MLQLSFGKGPESDLHVLCLGAHSDDIELGCGATILRLVSEYPRCSVHWVVLSSNEDREREARASAADFLQGVVQSTVIVQNFRESYFPFVAGEIKDFFEQLKQTLNPDVVFCHHRHDAHQDHQLVANLTWNTFRNHLILEYEIPKYEGDLGHPNMYVPVSRKCAEQKILLLHKHFATQRNRSWFRTELFDGLMTLRGMECNAPENHAEAFHLRKGII